MMSVDEKAREMASQYIPHEGGFSMGGLLIAVIEHFEGLVAINDTLYRQRNAAQQRAEQAERERDEAREYLRRITAIVDGWARVPSTMPDAWDTICGVLNERDLMTAPQAQPAPTVKANDGELSMQQLIDRAFLLLLEADDSWLGSDVRITRLHSAVRDLLGVVERLVKGGAS